MAVERDADRQTGRWMELPLRREHPCGELHTAQESLDFPTLWNREEQRFYQGLGSALSYEGPRGHTPGRLIYHLNKVLPAPEEGRSKPIKVLSSFQETHSKFGVRVPVSERRTVPAKPQTCPGCMQICAVWGQKLSSVNTHSPHFSSFQAVGSGPSSPLHGSN